MKTTGKFHLSKQNYVDIYFILYRPGNFSRLLRVALIFVALLSVADCNGTKETEREPTSKKLHRFSCC